MANKEAFCNFAIFVKLPAPLPQAQTEAVTDFLTREDISCILYIHFQAVLDPHAMGGRMHI